MSHCKECGLEIENIRELQLHRAATGHRQDSGAHAMSEPLDMADRDMLYTVTAGRRALSRIAHLEATLSHTEEELREARARLERLQCDDGGPVLPCGRPPCAILEMRLREARDLQKGAEYNEGLIQAELQEARRAAEHDAQTIRDQAAGYNKEIASLKANLTAEQARREEVERDLAETREAHGCDEWCDDKPHKSVVVQLKADLSRVQAHLDALNGDADILAQRLADEHARAERLIGVLRAGNTPLPFFLEWIAARLIGHGENENVDFVIALREHAQRIRAALTADREALTPRPAAPLCVVCGESERDNMAHTSMHNHAPNADPEYKCHDFKPAVPRSHREDT